MYNKQKGFKYTSKLLVEKLKQLLKKEIAEVSKVDGAYNELLAIHCQLLKYAITLLKYIIDKLNINSTYHSTY